MPDKSPATDRAKQAAAHRAAETVRDGMRVGLGTGSTASFLIQCLGKRIRDTGLEITAVATSMRTAELARKEGIALTSLDNTPWLDLTIDGADEFDADLRLIKGGGGALLREKLVATASKHMVVIADVSKGVGELGAFPLPVEVVPFGMNATQRLIARALENQDVAMREIVPRLNGNRPFETDGGNFILDLHLGRIGHPDDLCATLNQLPGVVENGLFINICNEVVVGHEDGRTELRSRDGIREFGVGELIRTRERSDDIRL